MKIKSNEENKNILMITWFIMANQQTITWCQVTCFIFGCAWGTAYVWTSLRPLIRPNMTISPARGREPRGAVGLVRPSSSGGDIFSYKSNTLDL